MEIMEIELLLEFAGLALIPLIIGLVELLKKLGLPDKYAPIPSLVLGLCAGVFLISQGDVKAGIVYGIYMGLSAVGLYSGTKNTKSKN